MTKPNGDGAKRLDEARKLGESFLGFEVCWDFGCHDARAIRIDRTALKELFTACGKGKYVEDLDVETCIKHATKIGRSHLCGGERIADDITPDKGGTKAGGRSPFVLGIFRPTTDGEADAKRELAARVRVEGEYAIACPPLGEVDYPDKVSKRHAEFIAKHANSAAHTVYNTELSKILCRVGRDLGWIPRRKNGGGVYFLPDRRADTVIALLDGLEGLCSEFDNNSTELLSLPRVANVWKRRASNHFEEAVEKLKKRLEKLETKGGNDSTAERASAETVLLKKDLVGYRALLGEKAGELDKLLDGLTKAFGDVEPSAVRARAKEAFAKTPDPDPPVAVECEDPTPETPEPTEPEAPTPEPKLKDRGAAAFAS
jgi:hypothetical protein